MLTAREARYVTARIQGLSRRQAAKSAGFPDWIQKEPSIIESPEVDSAIEKYTQELVDHALAQGLVDAKEIHEQLTDELRGDLAELYDENDQLRPVKDWPLWARQGGVEIIDEPNMVHSKDGGGSSWDQQGRKKIVRFTNRSKTRELAMKHKAVNAMVQANTNIDVNIAVVTAEQARELSAAQKRLARVVEAKVIENEDHK